MRTARRLNLERLLDDASKGRNGVRMTSRSRKLGGALSGGVNTTNAHTIQLHSPVSVIFRMPSQPNWPRHIGSRP
jgi:hypothetical protein